MDRMLRCRETKNKGKNRRKVLKKYRFKFRKSNKIIFVFKN
mgnify:CR=1 FL=1